jgi:hypothetical protein
VPAELLDTFAELLDTLVSLLLDFAELLDTFAELLDSLVSLPLDLGATLDELLNLALELLESSQSSQADEDSVPSGFKIMSLSSSPQATRAMASDTIKANFLTLYSFSHIPNTKYKKKPQKAIYPYKR